MTTEPKLLTEAQWRKLFDNDSLIAVLYENGLIAPEPVDALLLEARRLVECTVQWSPQTDRDLQSGKNDSTPVVKIALAALRRGREIGLAERPELTLERVRDAVIAAEPAMIEACDFESPRYPRHKENAEAFVTRLHAALTDGEVGNG